MITNVLICDDSGMARKLMARALPLDWDVQVSFAEHGEEALAAIRKGLGDILFLDLNMPVMDGYQTLEHIKQEDLSCMVIVVSGDVQPEAHKRVLALGAVEFIKKPTSTEVLTELLVNFGLYQPSEVSIEKPEVAGKVVHLLQVPEVGEISTRDFLQEIVNVAMGQAADLLARLLKVFIRLPVPNVNLLEVSELQMALAHSERNENYSTVCQGFIGAGISGEALLLFSDSSFKEVAKLLNYPGDLERSEELELLMELGSILIGACTSGIARQMDVTFSQGHPIVLGQNDRVSELVRSNTASGKQILAIELAYEIENYDIQCDLLLLFTEDSLDSLNTRLSYCMG
jgi:chemotaxis protein CheY-P-specific phosphatase CheC/ActR/RegA family two-component response regulator